MKSQPACKESKESRRSRGPGLNSRPSLAHLDDIRSNMSEEYVYKSPSKMTSPEKKAFSK